MHQGGISFRVVQPRVTNIYPNYKNIDRCPVRLFEKYVGLLPTAHKNGSLKMHARKKPTGTVWFLDYPLGINTITPLVKELVHRRFSLLRTMMTTRMYDQNQDEQPMQEFTGHRSTCVRRYKPQTILNIRLVISYRGQMCIGSKLSNTKSKKSVGKGKLVEFGKKITDTDSEAEFMSLQSLCTFKGKPIENGSKERKCCPHGHNVSKNGSVICELLSEVTSQKYTKQR